MINLPSEHIQSKIYNIRGKQVMLDSDLAVIYQVETKRLKEQVNRNIERFPNDFLTESASTRCFNSQKKSLKS